MKWQRQFSVESLESRQLLAADLVPDGLIRNNLPIDGQRPEVRIVGGDIAQESWPMMVSLANRSGHICGGTLIAPDVVVTAAHCVDGENIDSLRARIGRADLRTNNGESLRISKVVSHPEYDFVTNEADIAILRLRSESLFKPVDVVRSDQTDLTNPGTTAIALGWGALDDGAIPEYPDELHRVDIPIVSNAVANRPIAYDGAITATMLAAGSLGKDSCGGDSGGPLLVQDEAGDYVLAGITSWGQGCGRINLPGIYTRVSSFEDWLSPFLLPPTAGRVSFDSDLYDLEATVTVTMRDENLVGQGSQDVAVTSSTGDKEILTLTENGVGLFTGVVQLSPANPQAANGVLEVEDNGVITLAYDDMDYGNGEPRTVTASAAVFGDDHGNDTQHATSLTLALTINGELETDGDVDWFSLDVTAGTTYEIFTVLRGLDDSIISLYDADANLITQNDDFGASTASKLVWQAPADGTYFVEVSGYENSTGRYLLRAVESELSDDHSNGPINATVAQVGLNHGEIESESDPDWFQFRAVQGVRYTIATQLLGLTDSYLRLIDTDGESELDSNDDINNSTASRIVWTAASDGTYYFEVTGWQGDTGTYNVNFTASIPQDDFEPNNSLNTSAELTSGGISLLNLSIHSVNNDDWYRWNAAESGVHTVSLDFDPTLGNVDVYVYDQAGVLLGDSSGNSSRAVVIDADPARSIFVRVDGGGATIARYGLSISVGAASVLGDLTGDGELKVDDMDALCGALRRAETDEAFDIDSNGTVDELDLDFLLEDVLHTVFGDITLDGRFDSSDLVAVFTAAEYEDSVPGNSNWSTGDWNCDGDFDTKDLVAVFQRATYSNSALPNNLDVRGNIGEIWWDRQQRRIARR